MTRLLLILALLAAGCLPVWATTYYVDNCVVVGSDSNIGTSTSKPWLTIAHVNGQTFNPGDSVLFESTCTWREQLVPPSSGSSGSPIIFGAYGTGAAPILEGTSVVTGWASYGSGIYHAAVSWNPNMVFQNGAPLTMETSTAAMIAGSYYYDSGTSTLYVWMTDGSNPSGYTVEASRYPLVTAGPENGNAGLVDLANVNYVTVNGLNIKESNYYGVRLSVANNITIENSSLEYSYHNGITASEAGVANSSNLSILNNSFSRIGITRAEGGNEGVAINFDGIQTGLASGNTIDSGYAENIQMNGGASNITVTKNLITNAIYAGVYVSSGWENGGNTTNVVVSYNEVAAASGPNPIPYAIALESSGSIVGVEMYGNIGNCNGTDSPGILFGYGSDGGGVLQHFTIVNNTIYNCFYGIQAYGPTSDTSNVFANNILHATYPWDLADTNSSNYSPDYDVLYDPSGSTVIIWESTNYTLTAFQSANSKMLHSVQGDPKFTNAGSGNFTLGSASPAIGAGANLGSTYQWGLAPSSSWPSSVLTLNQNSYGVGWAVGAFVFVQQILPAPPTHLSAKVE